MMRFDIMTTCLVDVARVDGKVEEDIIVKVDLAALGLSRIQRQDVALDDATEIEIITQ